MQFARIAVSVFPAEVVHAVCYVARLLYLGKEVAGAYGVETPGRKEEQVALMCLVGGYDILHGRASANGFRRSHALIVFGRYALLQPCIYLRPDIALMPRHAGYLPRFSYVGLRRIYSLKRRYTVSAPYRCLQIWFKLVWFHWFLML